MSKPSAFPDVRPHLRRRLGLALVVVTTLLLCVLQSDLQRLGLRAAGMPWFLDSYALLATSDAVQQGLDPWRPNPLDIYGRPHSYSSWWFVLGEFGLQRSDNPVFGSVMVAMFLGIAWLLLIPRSRGELAWQAALVLSPPVLLAVNRANNDLVVFAVLGLGLWLARRPSGNRLVWYGVAVALATGLKFYPVVAAGAVALLRPARRGVLWAAALSAVSLAVFASVYQDLLRAEFPTPIGVYLFGARIFWQNLDWGTPALVVLSLGGLTLAALILAWRGYTAGLASDDPTDEGERLAFLAGTLVLLACFVGGVSYAYRWVFALWLLPWLWRRAWAGGPATGRSLARTTCLLLLVVMWMDGIYCLVINSLFEVMEEAQQIRWSRLWNVCTQPLVWVLMTLLAGWLAEALFSVWRGLRRPVWVE